MYENYPRSSKNSFYRKLVKRFYCSLHCSLFNQPFLIFIAILLLSEDKPVKKRQNLMYQKIKVILNSKNFSTEMKIMKIMKKFFRRNIDTVFFQAFIFF